MSWLINLFECKSYDYGISDCYRLRHYFKFLNQILFSDMGQILHVTGSKFSFGFLHMKIVSGQHIFVVISHLKMYRDVLSNNQMFLW